MKEMHFYITQEDINEYAEGSGDYNPIHLDDDYAKKHGYSGRIAHGMLTMAKVWSVISSNLLTPTDFPNEYELTFLFPVYKREMVILRIDLQSNKLLVEGTCKGKCVVKGYILI